MGKTILWSPSLFFISNRFYQTRNNFGPLSDHIFTEFSWVVTLDPAVLSVDILRWPTYNITVAIVKTIEMVAYLLYQITQNNPRAL